MGCDYVTRHDRGVIMYQSVYTESGGCYDTRLALLPMHDFVIYANQDAFQTPNDEIWNIGIDTICPLGPRHSPLLSPTRLLTSSYVFSGIYTADASTQNQCTSNTSIKMTKELTFRQKWAKMSPKVIFCCFSLLVGDALFGYDTGSFGGILGNPVSPCVTHHNRCPHSRTGEIGVRQQLWHSECRRQIQICTHTDVTSLVASIHR